MTSGIRIGTPAVTTRGLREPGMGRVAELIDRVLTNVGNVDVATSVRDNVRDLVGRFPLYATAAVGPTR